MKPQVELLTFAGCPHAEPALAMVRDVLSQLAPDIEVEPIDVADPGQGSRLGFLGSPSIRIDGRDIEDRVDDPPSFACRVYPGGQGLPPRWLIEAALLRALGPGDLLFLCVANSARSQMAEGLARHILGDHLRVQSAGSTPTQVRPEAIRVLAEIGIDISGHRSKAVTSITAASVDTVITLCAEEVCPVFLSAARRLHWGLPDPAAVGGSERDRLGAFRATRDELRERLLRLSPTR